jgi:replicative DNA helicase
VSIVASVERVPPQNLEAEQGVLGSMLLDRDAIARVVEMLRPEDFYRDAHRRIYDAVVELFERGEPVDLITVTDRLRDKGQLDDVGGAAYVTALLNSIPTAANVEYYARIVLQKSMLRQLIAAGTQIAHLGFEGENDVELLIDRAEKLVFGIANRRLIQEFLPIREILKESFERIDRRYQDKGTLTGVATGFTDLDQLTSGLQPADLVIVAARPSMGKCLKYDAEIADARTGEVCTIQEIVGRKTARLWTVTESGTLTAASPSQFVDDGIKPVYRVRTGTGREVETTLSHPFLTPQGWRRLEELRVGDAVAVPGRLPVFGQVDLPAYEVKLLAYLFAGTMPTSAVLATDYADAVAVGEAIRSATHRSPGSGVLGPGSESREDEAVAAEEAVLPVQGGSEAEVVGVLRARYPALAGPADQEHLPALIFTLLRGKIQLFLSRLLACVSTVDTEPDVVVRSVFPSARMARQVQHLLLRFGVFAARQDAALVCSGDVARALFRDVGLLGWERLRTWARHDQGRLLADGDLRWDPIAAIEYTGDVQVYDLTVPRSHNFIANDVCVHNTTFSLNIAQHAAIHHSVPVAVFSLETSKEQLVQRFLCAEAEVDGSKLRTGFLSDSDWPKLARAMGRLSEAPVFIDDSANISVIEMRAKARKLKTEHGLGLIIVDYLQMIQSYKRTENRTQEISEIARSLKSLAKELDIPLIAVSQLSRAVELTGTRRPLLSHLRECVTGDTVVWDADTGRRWTVGELAKQSEWPRLLSLDKRGRLVPVRPAAVFEKGENEVFEIRTSTGRRLKATANHPVLTPEGWKKVADLNRGSLVATARRLPVLNPEQPTLSSERMRLFGYLVGDGSYKHGNLVTFCSADPLTYKDCVGIASREFGITPNHRTIRGTPVAELVALYPSAGGVLRGRSFGNRLKVWLRELGVEGQVSYTKRIPESFFVQADSLGLRSLLRAMFSTDGCLTRRKYQNGTYLWALHYDTVSRGLADDVRDLLLRFGIIAQVSSGYKGKMATVPIYRVTIEDSRHLARFCERIGIEGRKQFLVDQCMAELATRRSKAQIDRLPLAVTQTLWQQKERLGLSWRELGFRLQAGKTLDRSRAATLAQILGADDVLTQATDDVLWDRIVEINPRGIERVFDLVMLETHNFIANGIAIHNSGELEQVADLVVFIYREDYYNPETEKKNVAEIHIAKHRNGPIGQIELFFHKEHSKFGNLERRRA